MSSRTEIERYIDDPANKVPKGFDRNGFLKTANYLQAELKQVVNKRTFNRAARRSRETGGSARLADAAEELQMPVARPRDAPTTGCNYEARKRLKSLHSTVTAICTHDRIEIEKAAKELIEETLTDSTNATDVEKRRADLSLGAVWAINQLGSIIERASGHKPSGKNNKGAWDRPMLYAMALYQTYFDREISDSDDGPFVRFFHALWETAETVDGTGTSIRHRLGKAREEGKEWLMQWAEDVVRDVGGFPPIR